MRGDLVRHRGAGRSHPRQARSSGVVAVTRADTGLSVEDLLAEMGESSSSTRRVRNPYKNSMLAHICIAAKARAIAQVPLRAHLSEGEVIEDPDHPLNRLIAQPNSLQGWESFVEATIIHLDQDGIVHWIDPSASDERRIAESAELRARGARTMAVLARRREMTAVRSGGILTGWTWRNEQNGAGQFIPLADVATLRYPDPDDVDDGLPPHVPLCRAVLHHNLSADFNNAAMANGGEVGTIYQTDQFLTEDQVRDLRREIAPRHRPDGHRRFAIAHGGLKIDRGTDALRDIDNLNGMRLDGEYIGAAYGVPPIMRGDYSDATYANARTQKVLFWEMIGLYLLRQIERSANKFFLRGDQARYSLAFFDEAVPELKWRAAEFAKETSGLISSGFARNEINRRYDLGFEDQPWGEEPMVGAGLLPISLVMDGARDALAADNSPEGGAPEDGASGGEPPDDAAPDDDDDRGARGRALVSRARAAEAEITRLSRAIRETTDHVRAEDARDRRIQRIHDAWNATWAGLRRSAGVKLAAFIRRQGAEMKSRLAEALNTRADGDTVPVGADVIDKVMIDLVEENGRLETVVRPLVRDAIELGGKQIVREVGEGGAAIAFDLDAPEVAEHVRAQVIRLRDVNKTTIERVRESLLKGLEQGESLAELGDRIDRITRDQGKARGYRIAQTELHEAISAGRAESMRQAGVDGKAWLTSGRPVKTKTNPNGVVRPAHKWAERATRDGIPLTAEFVLIDEDGVRETAQYPGDAKLSAGNRINCSCVQVARTLARGERSEEIPLPDPERLLTYEDMIRERGAR